MSAPRVRRIVRLFNFGRRWRLSLAPLVRDDFQPDGWWLSGRVAGRLISLNWPPR